MQQRGLPFWLLLAIAGCSNNSGGSGTISMGTVTVPSGESGDITVTVQRSGDSSGKISVPYATHAGTALETSDFVPAMGSVEWADGDTADKTITVSLVDDLVIEPSEDMTIELGKPSGEGVLAGNASTTVTILDDDHPGDSYAVTSAHRLVHFDRADPGRLSWSVDLSGLGNENVVAVDIRPTDGQLYALTDAAKLYTIDPMTGAATPKATLAADPADTTSPFTQLSGTSFGMDFNPVVDRLRITSSTGQNLRVNADTGAVTTDAAINGLASGYTAIAHNNDIASACRTSLFAIDPNTNRFLSQSTGGDGATQGVGGLGLDATGTGGFDVVTDAAGASSAFAILTVNGAAGMYAIDLASGAATVARDIVGPLPAGETVTSFAMSPLPASTPATQREGELYGVTATDLESFNRANPEKLCTTKPITGLATGEAILDLDMRPSTGVLYVLTKIGTAGKLHRVDPVTGNLSPAISVSVALQGSEFSMDFDPTGNVPLRIVSNSGQNLRVTDLTTGASVADTALNGAATTAAGAAYTDAVPGAGTATLYSIDAAADRLRIQSPPNSGTLVDVGPLGVDVADAKFDIDGRDNAAFVVATVGSSSELHTIDLATGTLSASFGTIAGAPLKGMTRVTPLTNVFGVTTDGKLVRISLTDPSNVTVISDPMSMTPTDKITGLSGGEHLVAIDFRPGTNTMYGVGSSGSLYTVNSSVASANKVCTLTADPTDTSSPFSALAGTAFDIDFDPTGTVPMRIVSDAEQNVRIPNVTANAPKVFTDAPLSAGGSPIDVAAAAYTNSFVPPAGVTLSTTLYVIDLASSQLMTASPSTGALTPVGPLAASGSFYDPGMPALTGFDIAGGNNGVALAVFQRPAAGGGLEAFSRLYRINLATGAATEIGSGIGGGLPIRGLAVQIR